MLRDYQRKAVEQVQAHWARGAHRVCVATPTGSGKTVVAGALLAGARSPLALVHTLTLLDQTRARLPGVRVLTVQGALAAGVPLETDRVFLDECHHLAAGTWRTVAALLPPGVPTVGCTATPERSDGAPLGDLFSAIVSPVSYTDLVRAGYLTPAAVRHLPGMAPVDAYIRHGRDPLSGNWQPGVIFTRSIAAADSTVLALRAAGVRAASVTASTPQAERELALSAYSAGQLDALASPMALSEGFDAPRATVCVLDRTCTHSGIYLQCVGRVLRPSPGKRQALLLDLRGASERHGSPTADRIYSLSGRAGDGIRLAPVARRDSPRPPSTTQYRAAPVRRADPAAPRVPPAIVSFGRALFGWLTGVP